jgi:excisionase family DNA binding protein
LSEKQRQHPGPLALSLHAPQDWPELLSPQDVAGLLRIATGTVARWCETGQIEAVRVGRRWRIPPEAVWPLVPPSIRAQWPAGPWRGVDATDPA